MSQITWTQQWAQMIHHPGRWDAKKNARARAVKTYTATVTREGRWWMIRVPEIDGITQARRLGEAELMACELIAVTMDVKLSEVAVCVETPEIDGVPDFAARIERIRADKAHAAQLEAATQNESRSLARELVSAGVPLRDAAEVLGVTYQRVHQLATAAHEPTDENAAQQQVG